MNSMIDRRLTVSEVASSLMRYLLAALALVACAPSESLPATCSPACAAGQVCVNAQCLVPADAGADAAQDVAAVDVPAADALQDVVAQDSGTPDAAVDAVVDAPADADRDAHTDAPIDLLNPRCPSGISAMCGPIDVNLQTGVPQSDGTTLHCGACGVRCQVGYVCEVCQCVR